MAHLVNVAGKSLRRPVTARQLLRGGFDREAALAELRARMDAIERDEREAEGED